MILTRWWPLAFALCTSAFTSRSVMLVNAGLGGWALFLSLLNVVLASTATAHSRALRRMMIGALVGTALLHFLLGHYASDQAICIVRTPYRTTTIGHSNRYLDASGPLNKLQWYDVNSLLDLQDSMVSVSTVQIHEGDTTRQQALLSDLLKPRNVSSVYGPNTLIDWSLLAFFATSLINFTLVLLALRSKRLSTWATLRSVTGLSIFIAIGCVVGSVKTPPDIWLRNMFFTRGDDWLRYIASSQDILAGNLALIPIPGGVEMWGIGIAYFFAAIQGILGPALLPISIALHGAHYAIVWAFFTLPNSDEKWVGIILGFAALLFIEADLNRQYAWTFMSDTLPLVLFGLLLVGLVRGSGLWKLGLASALLFLLRAEYIAITPLLALTVVPGTRRSPRSLVPLLMPFFITVGLVVLRKVVLYNSIDPFISNGAPWDTLLDIRHMGLKTWAILGRYDLLDPSFQHRYHWWAVHALFVASALYYFLRCERDRNILFILASWLWFVLTRLTSPAIGVYGFRHSLVLILLEMLSIALIFIRYSRKNIRIERAGLQS